MYTISENLEYLREPENQCREHAVLVYLKKTNQRMETIGHIPDAFIKVVDGLMSQWKAPQVIDKTDGKHGVVLEGASVSGGEIEISCIYCLYVAKAHKSIV